MNLTVNNTEQSAAAAFSEQSAIFDELYASNLIVDYKRRRVRAHVLQWLPPQSNILELNSGTGQDALFFASLGHHVHATDISGGMQSVLKKKVSQLQAQHCISTERCSFTELQQLKSRGPYDLIFSNFAGLNCTGELNKVIHEFDSLLKPGGMATMVLLPGFCTWESLLLFRGKLKTATRRWFSSKGVKAHIEGHYFTCWYYPTRSVLKMLPENFEVLGLEGLCTIVPPSYIEGFGNRYPRLFRWLCAKEDQLKSSWPFRSTGDYYILTIRKRIS